MGPAEEVLDWRKGGIRQRRTTGAFTGDRRSVRSGDGGLIVTSGGRREEGKAERRRAILDATATLLRERPFDEVTVDEIAALAEVVPATVYNLVGPRDRILIGLIDRVVEDLSSQLAQLPEAMGDDPIAVAQSIVDLSVEAFVRDSIVYQRAIAGWNGDISQYQQRASDPAGLQVAAMEAAQAKGIIRVDADPVAIGQQIYVSYSGSFLLWALGGLDDEGFRATARHGLALIVLAVAAPAHRATFEAEIRQLSRDVARTRSSGP